MATNNTERKILIVIPESILSAFELSCEKSNRTYKNMAETIILEYFNSKPTTDGKEEKV